jgi:hypothetical protein
VLKAVNQSINPSIHQSINKLSSSNNPTNATKKHRSEEKQQLSK